MALDSIGSDLNKISIRPVNQVGEIQLNSSIKMNIPAVSTPSIEKDGANVNANKGRIPASGSIFGGEVKNSGAEKAISQSSGDKKQLQAFLSALENVNLSDGIDNESNDVMNELTNLGFDIRVESGKIVISDADGNQITPEDFNAIKDNLKNTIKRSISNLDSQSSTSAKGSVSAVGSVSQTSTTPPKTMSIAQEEEMLNVLKTNFDTNKEIKEVATPLKADIEAKIKAYEAKMSQAENQSKKIDMSISQIISLKSQAEVIIEKSKTKPLTEMEKKQLSSISSTIELKQKEMQSYQQGNEVLMQQIDQVYSQFSNNLSDTEKSTKNAMQEALKSKVSGQSLTVRQNFLSSISEDIYKLTSNMTPQELEKTMLDPSARVKMFAPTNKLIDKMSTAKSMSDFSTQDLQNLKDKFNIVAVEENGEVAFYYQADKNAKSEKVSKDDLKQMRVDLNNVVTSPDLFTLARASGQISMAYDKDNGLISLKPTEENNKPVETQNADEISKKDEENSSKDQIIKKRDDNKPNLKDDGSMKNKESKTLEVRSIEKSIDQKREEEKYHEKQLKNIYENRREINKFIATKRNIELEQEREIKNKEINNI